MWSKILAVVVVAILALGAMGDADARQKEQRAKRSATPPLQYDSSGTPSIMRGGDRGISIMRDENAPKGEAKEAARPRKVPRGSSTYIPPPIPSPNIGRAAVAPATPGGLQAAADQQLRRPRDRMRSFLPVERRHRQQPDRPAELHPPVCELTAPAIAAPR
jgi:hypothetical protein